MCHHRGYEYLREREERREESPDENDERREPIRSVDREEVDARDGDDEHAEEPEPTVPGPADD